MMKKKLSIAISALLVIALLAGCSTPAPAPAPADPAPADPAPSNPAPADPAPSGGDPVKLVIAARGGLHVDAINSVKDSFEAANNCTIEVLGLEADDLKQKVSLDSRNAQGSYDLIMADDPWMPEFSEADLFLNLTAEGVSEDADFIPASLALGKDPYGTGDLYALPFAGNVQLLFYNKQLLSDKGFEVPTDWQTALDIAKALKADGKHGYVIRGQQGNPIVSDYLPVLWAFGGDVFDASWNVLVDSAEAKAALQLYMDLLANGENFEKNDIVSSVSDGNAGMGLGWPSWFISGADATAAYAAIPNKAAPDAPEKATGMIGHWMMGVAANSTNKELAIELLQHLTSAESQKIMADNGGVPTRISVYSDAELSAKYAYFPTLLDATINSVVRPRTPKWSEIETVYGAELSAAISGAKSIDQALADAKAGIEAIIK